MGYQTVQPGPELAPFVAGFWEFDSGLSAATEAAVRKVVPDGASKLVINIENFSWITQGEQPAPTPGALFQGICSRPYRLHSQHRTRSFGIHFRPEGLIRLFGIPMAGTADRFFDLEALFGNGIRSLTDAVRNADSFPARIRIAENWLRQCLQAGEKDTPYVEEALRLIRQTGGSITVENLSQRVFISRRQLERKFMEQVGLSPKLFLRIERLKRAIAAVQTPRAPITWAQLAYSCGYADQAHLIHDFRELAGDSPTGFLATGALTPMLLD